MLRRSSTMAPAPASFALLSSCLKRPAVWLLNVAIRIQLSFAPSGAPTAGATLEHNCALTGTLRTFALWRHAMSHLCAPGMTTGADCALPTRLACANWLHTFGLFKGDQAQTLTGQDAACWHNSQCVVHTAACSHYAVSRLH